MGRRESANNYLSSPHSQDRAHAEVSSDHACRRGSLSLLSPALYEERASYEERQLIASWIREQAHTYLGQLAARFLQQTHSPTLAPTFSFFGTDCYSSVIITSSSKLPNRQNINFRQLVLGCTKFEKQRLILLPCKLCTIVLD